jgi:hypothetical protein
VAAAKDPLAKRASSYPFGVTRDQMNRANDHSCYTLTARNQRTHVKPTLKWLNVLILEPTNRVDKVRWLDYSVA